MRLLLGKKLHQPLPTLLRHDTRQQSCLQNFVIILLHVGCFTCHLFSSDTVPTTTALHSSRNKLNKKTYIQFGPRTKERHKQQFESRT